MKIFFMGIGVAALMALTAPSEAVPTSRYSMEMPPVPKQQCKRGIASWYGKECEGNLTASGIPYDLQGLTAAHPTLPLGTIIRVTNLKNHHCVVLTVNDRGPHVAGRMLDVSEAAAHRLGFAARGTTRVMVQVLQFPHHYISQIESTENPPTPPVAIASVVHTGQLDSIK
jgi:rare lipoprotein A